MTNRYNRLSKQINETVNKLAKNSQQVIKKEGVTVIEKSGKVYVYVNKTRKK